MRLLFVLVLFTLVGCSDTDSSLLRIHNKFRKTHNVSALKVDKRLEKAATDHARWMAENNVLNHQGKNHSMPWDRVRKFGVNYKSMGENIAFGSDDPKEIFESWMDRDHKRNILHSSYTHVGIGKAQGKEYTYWVVVLADERENR